MLAIPERYTPQERILVYLNYYDFLRTDQLKRVLGYKADSRVSALIRPMVEEKLVYRLPLIGARGGKTWVYMLGEHGAARLRETREEWVTPKRPKRAELTNPKKYSPSWFAHVTGVNDFFLSYHEWGKTLPGFTSLQLWTEMDVKRDRRFHEAGLEPDGAVQFERSANENQYFFYLEYDRDYYNQKRWTEKVARYIQYAQESHERLMGVDIMEILVIAEEGKDHSEELLKWTAMYLREQGLSDYAVLFKMTGSPPTTLLFTDAVWYEPGNYDARGLFE
jgi:hypothetical protein